MNKKMILIGALVVFAAVNCSKSSGAAAAAAAASASTGSSGLDGTGVFTYGGSFTVLNDILTTGSAGAATYGTAVPSDAKFIQVIQNFYVGTGATSYLGTNNFCFQMKVEDVSSSGNALSLHSELVPIPTSTSLNRNVQIFYPTYSTANQVFDLRGKTVKFYNDNSNAPCNSAFNTNTKIQTYVIGFVK